MRWRVRLISVIHAEARVLVSAPISSLHKRQSLALTILGYLTRFRE